MDGNVKKKTETQNKKQSNHDIWKKLTKYWKLIEKTSNMKRQVSEYKTDLNIDLLVNVKERKRE